MLAFLLELPVELFQDFHLLFFLISRDLCADSVPLLFELLVLAVLRHTDVGNLMFANNHLPAFGFGPLEFIFLLDDLPLEQIQINSFEDGVGDNTLDYLSEGSATEIEGMFEEAHDLNLV